MFILLLTPFREQCIIYIVIEREVTTMLYGYARCSTNDTKQDIQRQTRELKAKGIAADNIYFEYESGTKADRTQLNRLLEQVEDGDTIISTELSRITRSTKQLIELIELIKKKNLKLIVGTFEVDCTTELDPMTLGMLQMMGVFAELERNMISQRVKSGMANAKSKGKTIGRPKLSIEQIPTNFMKYYPMLKDKQITITEMSRLTEMSRTTIYKYINLLSIN